MTEAIERQSVLSALQSIIDADTILVSGEHPFEDYLKDMGDFPSAPLAIIQPKSVAQVSTVVKYANARRIPVIARGAGTSLTGATATFGGLVLDFTKHMNKILAVDTTNWYVHCEAGVVLDDLNDELGKLGFFFPPDPSSTPWCTVGGVISENSGGMRTFRYGTVKNWVLALTVVLADGTVAKLGEPLPKNRVGYDLVHMICGSEGTLAVIADAWLKITPLPEETGTTIKRFMVFFSSWNDAVNSIVGIRSSRLIPNLLEFIDGEAMKAINDSFDLKVPVHEATLFIEANEELIPKILSICSSNSCVESYIAKDEKDGERLHSARALLLLGIKALDTGVYNEDTVVPLDRLADYIAFVKLTAEKYGLRIPVGGHAGDGNVHPTIVFHRESKQSVAAADEAFKDLCEYAVALGGSVTGEHGIGVQKLAYARRQLLERNGSRVIDLMCEMKKIWDPNNILNPGKFLAEEASKSG